MYLYQENRRFFAQIAHSTEELGALELTELGARGVSTSYRGIFFDANPPSLYRIVYGSRLITRVLAPIAAFHCHNPDYLYRTAMGIEWTDFMQADQTFAVSANVSNSKIRHSKYAALRIKDAIVDQFRERTGGRPDVDTREPDLWINLYIENNHATISIDVSGGSLHRRGYRLEGGMAPMQETVAAAIIRHSGWQGEMPLYDPMCGSGTLLAEAHMHYCRIPAGFLRSRFGFEGMPDFEKRRWNEVKTEMDGLIRPLPEGLIAGSDSSFEAIAMARANLAALPGSEPIRLTVAPYQKLGGLANRTIVTNPPYGLRMGRDENLHPFYAELGDFLKQQCTGSKAFVYAGDRDLLKSVGLRPTWKKPLVNGALDGRLACYEMY
ncbi:MAG: THUMP domain-containing protein [Rhodothermales bacterium]|nr:THUMP domain-containing protein [Rhodothermales bacterium]